METLPELLQPWFAALIDIALAACAGLAALSRVAVGQTLARFGRISIGLLIAGLIAYLWAGGMAMSGAAFGDTFPVLWTVLSQTSFGSTIVLSCFACLFLAPAICMPQLEGAGGLRRGVIWFGLAMLCYARAASGHAMDQGWLSYAVAVHAVHVLAGAVWAGSVLLCALLAASWRNWLPQQRTALAHRVSHAATLALIAVALSGAFNTLRMLGQAQLSLADPYISLLAWKLLLVALALCMGAGNRWLVMPRLEKNDHMAQAHFGWILLAESAVLVAVMVVAARLGMMMPP